MKFLKNRTEIGKAINVDRIPVLTVDISNPMKGYPDCYSGSKVNVAGGRSKGYEDLLTRCTVKMYGDEPGNECHDEPWMYKKIILSGEIVGLKSSFTINDIISDVEWSNARTVKAGDAVIVFFRACNNGYLRLMKVSDRVNPHCSTVATLIDPD